MSHPSELFVAFEIATFGLIGCIVLYAFFRKPPK